MTAGLVVRGRAELALRPVRRRRDGRAGVSVIDYLVPGIMQELTHGWDPEEILEGFLTRLRKSEGIDEALVKALRTLFNAGGKPDDNLEADAPDQPCWRVQFGWSRHQLVPPRRSALS